jgi:hypothetical protein
MEAAGLWKAAPKKPAHLPTALGKRRHEPVGVSHISHSPCHGNGTAELKAIDSRYFAQSVTDVPGLICYLCSRLHPEGRVRGALALR